MAQTIKQAPPFIHIQVHPGEAAGVDNGGAVLGRANCGGELGVCGPMVGIKEAVEGSEV